MKKTSSKKQPSIGIELKTRVGGRFRASVVNAATGKTVRQYPWQNNLVLDAGLTYFTNNDNNGALIYALLTTAYAGTGTDPTQVAPDGTYAQSGTTVSRSTGTGTFGVDDVDRMIRFSTGEQARIVSRESSTSITVDRSATVAATALAVHHVDQEVLDTHVKNSTSLSSEDGDNATTQNSETGDCTIQKTWLFSEESGSVNYTEVGVGVSGQATVASDGLFSRIVLDSPINVQDGELLKLTYQFTMSDSGPITGEERTIAITGWPRPYGVSGITSTGSDFTITLDETHHYLAGGKINLADVTPPKFDISSIASDATRFTVTTDDDHGLSVADSVEIEGTDTSGYNGSWTVETAPTATTYTVLSASNLGASSNGTSRLSNPSPWYDDQEWEIDSVDGADVTVASAINPIDAGAGGTATNNLTATVQHNYYGLGEKGCIYENDGDGSGSTSTRTYCEIFLADDFPAVSETFPRALSVSTFAISEYEVAGETSTTGIGKRLSEYAIPVDEVNDDNIRAFGFAFGPNYSTNNARISIIVTFDEPQRKDSGYTLDLAITRTIEQTLAA